MPRRRKLPSIGAIFFAVMLALTVTGGTIVSIWRGQAAYRLEQRDLLTQDALLAHSLAQSVHLFLRSAVVTASTMGSEVKALPERTPEALQAVVMRFAEQNRGSFISMYVIDPTGIELADYFPAGRDETERVAGIGVNLSDRKYFQRAMTTRRPVVSDAVIGRSTMRPVVVVAVPIIGDDGEVLAIAAGSLDLQMLQQLGGKATDNSVAPVVIDAAGQAIVHRDAASVANLRNFADIEPARRAMAGETGTAASYVTVDGETYSAAFEPVADYGWSVWIGRDVSRFSALVRTVLRDTILSLFLLMLAAGVAFAIVSHFLFLPLKRMAAQSERVAQGDLNARIDLRGVIPSSEVTGLAERFNEMIAALKTSLETKSQFLSVVTHAFRTPITALRWQIESWNDREKELTPEQRESWSDCGQMIQRLQIGFDNVFVAQEINKKALHAERKPFNVAESVKEAVQRLSLLTKVSGIEVRVRADETPETKADSVRLLKAFEAVIANAILYSPPKSVVNVDVAHKDGAAVIRVEDKGIGMTPAERKRIFEPFYRSEPAKKYYTDGTGLGLFIAKAFIELNGGTIEFTSKEKSGTTVTIRLPLKA